MNRSLKLFLAFICLAGLASLFFYIRPPQIVVVKPLRGPAVQAIYATGTVEPTVMVPISAKSTTKLTGLYADEGQNVTRGEPLGQLENDELQKSLEEMQATVNLAEKEYQRRVALLEKNATSAQQVDQAHANLETARARVDQIKASLSNMLLVAPQDGTIIRRDGEIGELIPTGQTVFWLSSHQGLRISVEVDEEDIAAIKPGQKVLIHVDAHKGRVFTGAVQSITPKGDAISRSYRVRITLDDKTDLMIGMTAEANVIVRQSGNALLIPSTAIKDDRVFIPEGRKLVLRPVKIGARGVDATEIIDGIDDQTPVVKNVQTVKSLDRSYRTTSETWTVPEHDPSF